MYVQNALTSNLSPYIFLNGNCLKNVIFGNENVVIKQGIL